MREPLVSIIIPLYNVEKYVGYTLQSILAQTYTNFEVILVDDGSQDNSVAEAEKVLASSKVNWNVIRKENGGAASARNKGIKHANGEWIICPDSDDYFAPQMIERMVSEAEKNNVKCVFTDYRTTNISEIKGIVFEERGVFTYTAELAQRLFLERKIKLISPGLLLHKSVVESISYNENCPYDEDVYYVWEVLYKVGAVTFIDSNYYLYITRDGSTVHSLRAYNYLKTSKEYKQLVDKLTANYPDNRIVKYILPKYKLGGLHVLAKNNDYDVFKKTAIDDGYRKGMSELLKYPNMKLSLYTLIYCTSLKVFYVISRRH